MNSHNIFESYYKQIGFVKERSYSLMEHLKKGFIVASKNTFTRNTKTLKQSKIITYQPKTFENPNVVDIKSVIIEHSKLRINYPRLYDRLKSFPKLVLIAL